MEVLFVFDQFPESDDFRVASVDGRELTVVGLGADSGTPVIDLKPTMAEFRAVNVAQPEWVSDMMSAYFQP
ncbi:hypothetical protein AB0B50_19400 [Streptomyces sp. NPDC041068]|uniref:hypothetical protein n=1 Tax=Streptomyces sp. NPDC041068 TaxID=3155130 RepID=UPI0033E5048E